MYKANLIAAALLIINGSGLADAGSGAGVAENLIAEQLQKMDTAIQITSIEPSAMPGLYEVMLASGGLLYADPGGQFFVQGQLYRADGDKGMVNLTEKRLNARRLALFSAVDAADMIVFKPDGEVKARVTVFTDVDCPYCRKLHQEVPKLNALGIEVDYLAFPRGGERSAAFAKMQSLWCAAPEQRQTGMTKLKNGEAIASLSCESPVLEQFELGKKVGVTGTPALLFPDGQLVPGYVPAARLAAMLGLAPQ
ncbi:DsbC family protein [Marinobacterium rhizophilum]|uniref:Thiol:disulfide interchange protein n=1 Tax=Marinobacterium rhizophilum TaxID=420402 RepID=A0ABY5HIU0_9GAMM|nr:DsbC family protein [Marinobacterium rhizophilum]UTW12188.1 DsbC family protein [Marinobacterium rhizophilum]